MEETNTEGENKEEIVRFRRWIAMTPDGSWREFRGTPGMINITQGVDIVELVEKMMEARMGQFEQMYNGYSQMKRGLTPSNAEWIYSEMMASLESFLKFEQQNFSEKNNWTLPKDRRQFPPYLSDSPVLDGGTVIEDPKDEVRMKLLCGDFATKKMIKQFKTANKHILEKHGNFEGTSEQFTALGRNPNSSTNSPPATATSTHPTAVAPSVSSHTEFPALQPSLNRRPVCSGVGVRINASGEPTITVMNNDDTRVETPVAQIPRSSVRNFPSLMSLNVPVTNLPSLPVTTNAQPQFLALVISRSEGGEITSIESLPVQNLGESSDHRFGSTVLPRISENFGEELRIPRRRQNRSSGQRALQLQRQFTNTPSLRNQSDSGLSSTSNPANSSTRASTPATSNLDVETPILTSSTSQVDVTEEASDHEEVEENEEPSCPESLTVQVSNFIKNSTPAPEAAAIIPNEPETPRGPSYASIVSSLTSSSTPSTSSSYFDRNISSFSPGTSSSYASMAGSSGSSSGMASLSGRDVASCSQASNLDEWVEVKSKNVAIIKTVEPVEKPLVTIVSKPAKEEKTTVLAEVADAWDDLEVDPERESQLERRRLQKQKQRAAKKQRIKEEKRARNGAASTSEGLLENMENGESSSNTSSVNHSEGTEEALVTVLELVQFAEVPTDGDIFQDSETSVKAEDAKVVDEAPTEPSKPAEVVETGYYDETGRYCDDVIIKEEEEKPMRNIGNHADIQAEVVEHCKFIFRILWFQNNKKILKLRLEPKARDELEKRIEVSRAMMERVDYIGRAIVYRLAKHNIDSRVEANIITGAKRLCDVNRYQIVTDIEWTRALGSLVVGKFAKNYTYQNYLFAILALPKDFIPKFKEPDSRIADFKEIVLLTRVHIKRVNKLYEDLCLLYEFKTITVPRKDGRR